jgi:Ser/Thr protein kinase RdoA (MazF antagonist)
MNALNFEGLDPDTALSAVQEAFGVRPDGSFFSYPSYVNRVYGFKADDGKDYVAKFYRPGRWTMDAIAEEQRFALALAAAELPVVPPLMDLEGDTLPALSLEHGREGLLIPFSLFPKRGGRSFDADGPEDLRRLGSLAGRMHAISKALGEARPIRWRPRIRPGMAAAYGRELEASGAVDPRLYDEFMGLLAEAAEAIDGALDSASFSPLLLHGDFHRGNVLDRRDEGLLAIDFDDCCMGPAIQDLWMLLPGRIEDSRRELEAALAGYEDFMPFDYRQLALIEPLRLLRMIHYLAWQARQRSDPGFIEHFPRWGARAFWEQEMEDLRTQLLVLAR